MNLTSGEVYATARHLVAGWRDLTPEQRAALRRELASPTAFPDVARSLRGATRILADLQLPCGEGDPG